jgi:hypothetical protein
MCKQCLDKIKVMYTERVGIIAISKNDMFDILASLPKCPAMRALEELTPQGSEFWEDPTYCYEFLKKQRSSTHQLLISTAGARNQLFERVAELEEQLKSKS